MLQVSHFSKFSETLLYKNKKISYLFKNNGRPPSLQPEYKRQTTYKRNNLKITVTLGNPSDTPVNEEINRIQTKLPTQQKGNKKKRISRPDRNILSYLKKRRLPTLPLCRQYHRRERA